MGKQYQNQNQLAQIVSAPKQKKRNVLLSLFNSRKVTYAFSDKLMKSHFILVERVIVMFKKMSALVTAMDYEEK